MSSSIHETDVNSGRPQSWVGQSGGLFFLFAIELLLLALVLWAYLFSRNVYPGSFVGPSDIWWGVVAIVSAGWGTWFLLQSRNAAANWNIRHSHHLLAIVVASGAVLIGVLLLQIATMVVSSPVVIDARPKTSPKKDNSAASSASVVAGDAVNGKKWFGMSCVTCHGPTGEGVSNAAPSLRASDFLKTSDDNAIAALIRNGRAANDPANKTGKVMPAKGGNPFLDETKIADLVAFLKELDAQLGGSTSIAGGTASTTDFESVQAQLTNQPATIVKKWTVDDLSGLQIPADEESATLGMRAFVKATCNKCHMADVAGQQLGPTLDQIASKYSREKLLQHIVDPSAEINEKFQSHNLLLLDGRIVTGMIVHETDDEVRLMTDLLKPDQVEVIPTEEIEDQVKSKVSAMPKGLVDVLTEKEIAGLVAYVDTAGNQMLAANAPQLNRWVVPAVENKISATTWSVSNARPAKSFTQITQALNSSRYSITFFWLFTIATAVLALHFLWVIGAGTAIVLHRELQLSSAEQLRLSQQTLLFWFIGIAWLVLWFVFFFLIG